MKNFKKFLASFIVAAVILSTLPMYINAQENTFYVGRQALSQMPNSKALLYAYDKIVEGVENTEEEIIIYDNVNPISVEEMMMVFNAYQNDYAEHFWLGKGYLYSMYNEAEVISILPEYIITGNELESAKAVFEQRITEILSGINPSMSDYAKELYLHDKLAEIVTYVQAANSHNAYGALVEGNAVCEGYAEAFQVLLHRAGIRSYLVTGASINPSTNTSEGHEWNAVEIGGNFYYVDVTWDDQGDEIYHAYFNVPKTVLSLDHAFNELDYQVPECTSSDMFYFNVEEGKISEFTIENVTNAFKNGSLTATVYVDGDVSEFWSWLKANISDVAQKLGLVGGFSYGYSRLGNELKLHINPSVKITGASVDAGVDLTIKYYAQLSYGYENAIMRFTSETGKVTEVEGVFDETTGTYVYSYTGINPQCMGDKIDAKLICNGIIIAEKGDYSVKEYCNNLVSMWAGDLGLTESKFNKLKTLLADMLTYGAESQKYKNYNTGKLVNSYDWVSEYKSDFAIPGFVKSVTGNTSESKVKSVGVHMANINKVYFKMSLTNENIKITVNDALVDKNQLIANADGTYTYYSESLSATQFEKVFEIKLFDDANNVISVVKYNLNAYVNAKYNDATVGDIVKALNNYGQAALEYMTNDDDFNLDGDEL